jgi:hypothetical protein
MGAVASCTLNTVPPSSNVSAPSTLLAPLPPLGPLVDEEFLINREQQLLAQLAEVLRFRAALKAGVPPQVVAPVELTPTSSGAAAPVRKSSFPDVMAAPSCSPAAPSGSPAAPSRGTSVASGSTPSRGASFVLDVQPDGEVGAPAVPLRLDHPALGGVAALTAAAERRAKWFSEEKAPASADDSGAAGEFTPNPLLAVNRKSSGGGGGGGSGSSGNVQAGERISADNDGVGTSGSEGLGGGGGGGGVPATLALAPAAPPGSAAWLELHTQELLALGQRLNGDWLLDEPNSDSVKPLMVSLGAPEWIAKILLAGAPPPMTFELLPTRLSFQFHGMMLSQKHTYTWTGPNVHKTPDGGKHNSELLLTPAEPGVLCKVGTFVHFAGRGDLLSTHAFAEPNKHLLKLQLFKQGKEVLELNRVFLPKPQKKKK